MRNKSWTTIVTAGLLAATTGCVTDQMLNFGDDGGDRPAATKHQLSPDDFDRKAEEAASAPRVTSTTPAATAAANEAAKSPPPADAPGAAKPVAAPPAPGITPPAPPSPPRLTADDATTPAGESAAPRDEVYVDAMVGQVTGKPVYASQIFDRIGVEQLERLGQTLPRLEFKERAARLIVANLREQITNSLILAEAETGLNEQQQLGLLGFMQQKREELLAEFGGGVPKVADDELRRKTGHGLDEELEQFRQKLLTDKFLQEKLYPKINVNRREVERYYQDHADEFSASTTVQVRVIIANDEKTADSVDKALGEGVSFADVASKHSGFRASDGGLMPEHKLPGDLADYKELGWSELNEQVARLRQGERSKRVALPPSAGRGLFGWVYIEKLTGGKGQTLEEAQLLIEQRIRAQKFNQLSRKYIADLWETGNYSPVEDMAITLLDVAMARYARP